MTFAADRHIGRSMVRRVEVVEVDDSGEIQTITVQGLDGEFFELPLRNQPHGLSGVPPVGSVGILTMVNGRPDMAQLSNLEHPDLRPKNYKPGETVGYGPTEQLVEMVENGDVYIKSPSGIVHINP